MRKGKDRATKELNNYIAELSALALQKHKELMLEQALITPKLLFETGIRERHGNTYPARNHAGRNRKNEKSCKHRLCPRYDQQIYQCDEEAGESHTGKSINVLPSRAKRR